MKEILILVTKTGKKKQTLVDYLNKNLAGKAKVTLGKLADLVFEVEGKKVKVRLNDKNITDFSLVYFRRLGSDFLPHARTLAFCLDHLKIDYFDSYFGKTSLAGNKLTALIRLSLAGLPVMPSFFCWRDKVEGNIDCLENKYGYPLVAKELLLQQGKGIFLIKKRKDFDFLKKTKPEDQFFFQKFYPNEKEYRLLVLGDRVAVYERKIRIDPLEFRGNVALGAKEEFLKVNQAPKEMKTMAVKAAQILGLEVAGVDIFIASQTGKQWLLEVNRGPGFTYDLEVSSELLELASFFAQRLGIKK